jgi:mRNA interferase RelE/StbE
MTTIPLADAKAVGEFITGPLLEKPYVVGERLTNELTGYHSARQGAYRVIYRVDGQARTLHVVRIDHRSDVYRS